MAYFLAEVYLAATSPGGTAEAAARAAAEEVARDGSLLRFLRIIFVPGDETCFVAYEAANDCHRLQRQGLHKAPRRGNGRRKSYGLGRRALPFSPSLNVVA